MITLKVLTAGVLLAAPGSLVGAPGAQADPLTPPSPAEIAFLDHARRVFPGSGDPDAFNSDGELLDQGRYACMKRDLDGQVGWEATFVSPIITQLAFIYLCPQSTASSQQLQ